MSEPVYVSCNEFNKLLDKWTCDNNSVPRDCFYAQAENGNYVAADNEGGEFFVEEFLTKEECLSWLNDPEKCV